MKIVSEILSAEMHRAIEQAYKKAYEKTGQTPKEINASLPAYRYYMVREAKRTVYWYLKDHFKAEPLVSNNIILDCLGISMNMKSSWSNLKRKHDEDSDN